jgi:predicted NAD/FAD-dependent oxidoreductase
VRDVRLERARAKAEAFAPLNLEAGSFDRAAGVSGRMATAGERRPEAAAIRDLEHGAQRLGARDQCS